MKVANLVGSRFKERPADCVIDSHALMVRGGYIKYVSNGIFSEFPTMRRVTRKIEEIIRQETRCIVDKCFELGNGDIALGVCRAVESGVLDVPFAPCRANAGLMLPCRDNNGAIRILNPGNLPFTKDILDFHAAKIEERARYEKRKASFQMVIDDVYSIGKGRLVGRPR